MPKFFVAKKKLCVVLGAVLVLIVIIDCMSLFAAKSADAALKPSDSSLKEISKEVASPNANLNSILQEEAKLARATAGTKPKLSLKKGDYELILDGSLKIENYYDDNSYMLNKNIPDEIQYFKETVDLNFDFSYGEEKYGYDAVEAYLGIRHKGIWGQPLSFADRDSGTSEPALVPLDKTLFGKHTHFTSRSVLWIREGWIKFALNPVFGAKGRSHLQQLELGWFPFQLGRGIALGNGYGYTEYFLGLYSYTGEDKYAPGIDLFGEIVKDTLWYDLYYARFEERGKKFSDLINPVKYSYMGRKLTPYRGTDKNNELLAARLKWVAVNNEQFGKLEVEPYVSCNFASDQWVDINPDTNTTLGAYGVGLEHTYQDFEWGSEVAFNFGAERLKAVDKNVAKLDRDDSNGSAIFERYSHINDTSSGVPAKVTSESIKAAAVDFNPGTGNENGKPIPGYLQYTNDKNRFRYAYKNEFHGWMGVLDAAYNLRKWDVKIAASLSYASGDVNPHQDQVNKNYNGFVGLHEGYYGKRVPSIFLMDQRLLMRPLALGAPKNNAQIAADVENDISFTNMVMYGIGFTWSPHYSQQRTVSINPNAISFWATKQSHAIDYAMINGVKTAVISQDMARNYLGTEANLVIKSEILKDLTIFGKFAVFFPGDYFKDVKGMPLDGDFFSRLALSVENYDPEEYRLAADTAYHMNIGFEFKF